MLDWNRVHQLLTIVTNIGGVPGMNQLRSAALSELEAIENSLTPKPAPMPAPDLKAANMSAPEGAKTAESVGSDPSAGVVRNVYEGLPGPAEAKGTE